MCCGSAGFTLGVFNTSAWTLRFIRSGGRMLAALGGSGTALTVRAAPAHSAKSAPRIFTARAGVMFERRTLVFTVIPSVIPSSTRSATTQRTLHQRPDYLLEQREFVTNNFRVTIDTLQARTIQAGRENTHFQIYRKTGFLKTGFPEFLISGNLESRVMR